MCPLVHFRFSLLIFCTAVTTYGADVPTLTAQLLWIVWASARWAGERLPSTRWQNGLQLAVWEQNYMKATCLCVYCTKHRGLMYWYCTWMTTGSIEQFNSFHAIESTHYGTVYSYWECRPNQTVHVLVNSFHPIQVFLFECKSFTNVSHT